MKVKLDAWIKCHLEHTPATLAREVGCCKVTIWNWRNGLCRALPRNAKRVSEITLGAVELPVVSRKPLPRDRLTKDD